MSRKPASPKDEMASGIVMTALSIFLFVRICIRMNENWLQSMVFVILLGLVSISIVYSGFTRLKEEKEKKAALKAAEEKPLVLDKQAMIDQVRKVLNTFQKKEAVRNAGVYKDYIYRYEQQLLALEQDINQDCIKGTGHIYADNDAYDRNDPFIDEISKAERMLHDYLQKEAPRLKQLAKPWTDYAASAQMEVAIDGSKISCYKDFIDAVQKELQFLEDCGGRVDRFLEQIRDLSWLPYKTYVFTIFKSADLERRNNGLLKQIVSHFDKDIIPFWHHQVVYVVVDGEPKNVQLNLIEGEDHRPLTPLECYIIDALASELEKNQSPHRDLIRKENVVSKESTPYYSFLFLPRTIEYSVGKPGRSYMGLEISLDQGCPAIALLHEKYRTFTMIEIYMADSSALPENPTITGYKNYLFKN